MDRRKVSEDVMFHGCRRRSQIPGCQMLDDLLVLGHCLASRQLTGQESVPDRLCHFVQDLDCPLKGLIPRIRENSLMEGNIAFEIALDVTCFEACFHSCVGDPELRQKAFKRFAFQRFDRMAL
jgi:hypothetical protein